MNARGRSPSTSSADLNGPKSANDELGHAVGDVLLHRAGEVFGSLVEKPSSVSRIGGDEFAVLLPAPDIAGGGDAVLVTLAGLIELNNQYYPDFEFSISTGMATSRPGDRLEQVVKRADMKMLHAKHPRLRLIARILLSMLCGGDQQVP